MDECWIDVTGSRLTSGTAMEIAEEIRKATREELGLTVSIGVSFNKIFAKLGSDMRKPDAITEITPENYRDKVWPLPASDLLYVGRATAKKLADRSVYTIGDIAATDPAFLRCWLGINGVALWTFASGNDSSRVMKRAYTLYRVSTKQQVDRERDDIPMQKQACREFAAVQGWDILKEFEEKGVSGFKVSANDRDAIQDLKNAAMKNEFDVLLVFMFDRIGRIDDETPFVVEWFVKHESPA